MILNQKNKYYSSNKIYLCKKQVKMIHWRNQKTSMLIITKFSHITDEKIYILDNSRLSVDHSAAIRFHQYIVGRFLLFAKAVDPCKHNIYRVKRRSSYDHKSSVVCLICERHQSSPVLAQVQQHDQTTDEIHFYSLFDSLQLSSQNPRTEAVQVEEVEEVVEVEASVQQENRQGMFHLTQSTIIEPIPRQKPQQLSLMIRILKFRISLLKDSGFGEIYITYPWLEKSSKEILLVFLPIRKLCIPQCSI